MTTTGGQVIRKAAANPWPERLARLGLAARGVLFIVIGILTFRVAFGHSEDQASQKGALQEIASQPGGKVLVWIVAIGLIGYALWRLLSAALGPVADPVATDAKQRVKALAEGIGYGAVAIIAVKIATGSGSSSSGGGQKQTATVLSWPGGQFLVGLAGARDHRSRPVLRPRRLDGRLHQGAQGRRDVAEGAQGGHRARPVRPDRPGRRLRHHRRAGHDRRRTYDPNKAKGLDGALKTLAAQPYGKWLLGVHRARLPRLRGVRPGRGQAAPGQLSPAPTSSAISAVLSAAPLRRLSPTTNRSSVFGKSSACRSRPT